MKNIVLSSVVTALLVFSGCSPKAPAVDESVNNESIKEASVVRSETVSAQSSIISSGSTSSSSMTDIESTLGSIYFGFDEFTINSDMKNEVSKDANIAKSEASKYKIKLEGNCDEWGSDEYNFALGLKRAHAVKKALIAEGVEGNNITMVSYGESDPICFEKSQGCWAKNRRVDLKLLP